MKDYNDLTTRLRSAAVEEGMERRQLLLCAAGAIDEMQKELTPYKEAETAGVLVLSSEPWKQHLLSPENIKVVKGNLLWLCGPLNTMAGYKKRMCQSALEIIEAVETALKGVDADA